MIKLIFAVYSPCATLGRNIRRSLIQPLLKVQATANWGTSCLGLFFSQFLKTIKDFEQPLPILYYPQIFSHYIQSETLISACACYLSTSNHEPLCRAWHHLLTGTGDAVKSLKSFLLQAAQVLVPEPLITGKEHQVLTIVQARNLGFYVSVHQGLLVLAKRCAPLPVRPQPISPKPVHQNQCFIH